VERVSLNFRTGVGGNDGDGGSGEQQAFDLGCGDGTGSDDQAGARCELEKHGEEAVILNL
jgi:hypothetical protein